MNSLCTVLLVTALGAPAVLYATEPNTLSPQEKKDQWVLLFDGHTMSHWVDPSRSSPPGDAWTIEDGCIKANPNPKITEDLLSAEKYTDFELQWDWKISEGGNSGVKYRIQKLIPLTADTVDRSTKKKFEDVANAAARLPAETERAKLKPGARGQLYVVGFEYQMIDNTRHPDAKHGQAYQTAALYSIVGPSPDTSLPAGEWNHSRLVVQGNQVQHYLNGKKVVDTTLDSPELKANLARRWGNGSPIYDLMVNESNHKCPISLQNHGNVAWFRSIKIRPL